MRFPRSVPLPARLESSCPSSSPAGQEEAKRTGPTFGDEVGPVREYLPTRIRRDSLVVFQPLEHRVDHELSGRRLLLGEVERFAEKMRGGIHQTLPFGLGPFGVDDPIGDELFLRLGGDIIDRLAQVAGELIRESCDDFPIFCAFQ